MGPQLVKPLLNSHSRDYFVLRNRIIFLGLFLALMVGLNKTSERVCPLKGSLGAELSLIHLPNCLWDSEMLRFLCGGVISGSAVWSRQWYLSLGDPVFWVLYLPAIVTVTEAPRSQF